MNTCEIIRNHCLRRATVCGDIQIDLRATCVLPFELQDSVHAQTDRRHTQGSLTARTCTQLYGIRTALFVSRPSVRSSGSRFPAGRQFRCTAKLLAERHGCCSTESSEGQYVAPVTLVFRIAISFYAYKIFSVGTQTCQVALCTATNGLFRAPVATVCAVLETPSCLTATGGPSNLRTIRGQVTSCQRGRDNATRNLMYTHVIYEHCATFGRSSSRRIREELYINGFTAIIGKRDYRIAKRTRIGGYIAGGVIYALLNECTAVSGNLYA